MAVMTAAAAAAVLYLMLDSGLVSPEPAARVVSVSLGVLAVLFGVGAWATAVGGQRSRSPLLAGLALGLGAYAVVRLFLP